MRQGSLGVLALAAALAALGAVPVPGLGKYAAVGLGIAAAGLGWVGFRRGQAAPRLCGAAGIALGSVALLLGGVKIALTLAALGHLETFLSP